MYIQNQASSLMRSQAHTGHQYVCTRTRTYTSHTSRHILTKTCCMICTHNPSIHTRTTAHLHSYVCSISIPHTQTHMRTLHIHTQYTLSMLMYRYIHRNPRYTFVEFKYMRGVCTSVTWICNVMECIRMCQCFSVYIHMGVRGADFIW